MSNSNSISVSLLCLCNFHHLSLSWTLHSLARPTFLIFSHNISLASQLVTFLSLSSRSTECRQRTIAIRIVYQISKVISINRHHLTLVLEKVCILLFNSLVFAYHFFRSECDHRAVVWWSKNHQRQFSLSRNVFIHLVYNLYLRWCNRRKGHLTPG
jgi:hypothetical protein